MEITEFIKENVNLTPVETVEVTKNSKGTNWSVKLIGVDLVRLKTITDELNRIYCQ